MSSGFSVFMRRNLDPGRKVVSYMYLDSHLTSSYTDESTEELEPRGIRSSKIFLVSLNPVSPLPNPLK